MVLFMYVNYLLASPVSLPPFADTIILQEKAYKMNKKSFLDLFGKDDSSKALIQFYYRQRLNGTRFLAIGIPVTIGSAFGFGAAMDKVNNDKIGSLDDTINNAFIAGVVGLLLGLGVAFILVGAPFWMKYFRKRLYRQLQNYFVGHHISSRIAKNHMFRGYAEYGDWNVAIRKEIKAERQRERKANSNN